MIRTLIIGLALAAAMPAAAADMTFYLKNENARAIVVELHSQSRPMRWPGRDKVFLLEPGQRKATPIACEAGERVCYAAWLNGYVDRAWGVGPENDRACSDCCTMCAPGRSESFSIGR